jgi:hypothetical protein
LTGSAGTAPLPQAQAVGRLVDGTLGGNPIQQIAVRSKPGFLFSTALAKTPHRATPVVANQTLIRAPLILFIVGLVMASGATVAWKLGGKHARYSTKPDKTGPSPRGAGRCGPIRVATTPL